jgi:hypothetical protein
LDVGFLGNASVDSFLTFPKWETAISFRFRRWKIFQRRFAVIFDVGILGNVIFDSFSAFPTWETSFHSRIWRWTFGKRQFRVGFGGVFGGDGNLEKVVNS